MVLWANYVAVGALHAVAAPLGLARQVTSVLLIALGEAPLVVQAQVEQIISIWLRGVVETRQLALNVVGIIDLLS